jgi:uncharacterized protein (TIGR02118 family)
MKGKSMTAHLLIMYPHPKDVKEFDRAYREEHLPYAGPRLKGATGVVTKRVVGPSFAQPPYHLISDVSFPSLETLKATAASSGKEALNPPRRSAPAVRRQLWLLPTTHKHETAAPGQGSLPWPGLSSFTPLSRGAEYDQIRGVRKENFP